MADDPSASADDQPITFNVKSSSDAKYALTLPTSTTVLELKTKLSGSEYADIPADRQRLIYSGRVLKDPETLASYKIKDGHTVHMVRSAVSNQRQSAASGGVSAANNAGALGSGAGSARGPAGVPSNLATGTGNNPLAGLTGARYAGHAQLPGAGMFGPDGGMGAPPDPDQMANMMQNPQFASSINEALQNPQVLDMMIQQNPMLRDVPGARQMMQSPEFRRMMTDPDTIRSMSQMGRAMGMGAGGMPGMPGMGAAGAAGGFPAPGVTDTTPAGANSTTPSQPNATSPPAGTQLPPNPFAMFGNPNAPFGAGAGNANNPFGAAGNPFAALLGGAGAPGSPFAQAPRDPNATSPPQPIQPGQQPQQPQNPFLANNPFLQNPQAMQQMLAAMAGGAGGAGAGAGAEPSAAAGMNPFAAALASMGAGGGPPPPADTRPPEERYEEQLRQLNDMGFYEFERNVEALRRSGGSVQGAVEYLLTH